MKNRNTINKHYIIYNEIFPYKKSNFKFERDFNEDFPKINSKYFSPSFNQNEFKKSIKNDLLTVPTNKKGNKKLLINIKNLAIEEKKGYNNYKTENNYNHNFQTLNDIIINNILKKKKKNNQKNLINKLKEKDSDLISLSKNLEKNILENTSINFNNNLLKKIKNIDMSLNTNINETNKFKNIGINTKLSKTSSNFYNNNINNNNNNNKMIFPYKTKEIKEKKEINKNKEKNPKPKYKFIYSRNDNNINNIRTIISSNENKIIGNKKSNNIINKTTNNFRNKQKVNNVFIKLLSNDIVRKVELSDQQNNKISDEYVQNLLSKEIEEIKNTKIKKFEINKNSKLNNDELFINSKFRKNFDLKEENLDNYNFINNNYKKGNNYFNFIKEGKKENVIPYINQAMVLSKLKLFDLRTEIQMFDEKYLKKNTKLVELYTENKKQLLNDKDVIMELGQYFFNLLTSNNKEIENQNEGKYKNQIIMTDLNNDERDKNIYNEEEKNIIKDIIYQLSDDLNENLESYKNINKNNENVENSINHVINSISLAQLFEKLNRANGSTTGKKRRFNKIITNKKEEKSNNKLSNNFLKENNNKNNDEDNNNINIDNKQLLNNILFNLLEKKDTLLNKDNNSNNNNILNNILNTLNKRDGNMDIISNELKQVLTKVIQPNQEIKVKTSSINSRNLSSNINSKSNKNIMDKTENNKSLSKNKETKKMKTNIIKNKKTGNNKQAITENNETKDLNNSSLSHDLENPSIENDSNSNNDNNNLDNDNINDKDIIRTPSKNYIMFNKEKEMDLNTEKNINKSNHKKPILSLKNQNSNSQIKDSKANKNVRFSVPRQSLLNTVNNDNNKRLLNILNENSEFNNNDSFYEVDSPKNNNSKLINNNKNKFPFDNHNNESFVDENDLKEKANVRKYSSKNSTISKRASTISLIESLSKVKKKKFQKTRKEKSKNKNLVTLRNEEYNKKNKKEEILDIREEMLNRRLKNFFGKIKMLKNAEGDNYDEQLKMFIDNEIDKLNDWETKEQEMRINNFFSDLRLIRKKVALGGDIKFANPIKFSSTWTNFGKFKKM